MDAAIIEAVLRAAGDARRLACADALALADDLGLAPHQVGAAADAAGVKITRCELGLFGPRRLGEPAPEVDDDVDRVRERLSRLLAPELSCAEAWAIARELAVEPLAVGRAASALDRHIHLCQLGCF